MAYHSREKLETVEDMNQGNPNSVNAGNGHGGSQPWFSDTAPPPTAHASVLWAG